MREMFNVIIAALLIKLAKWLGFSAQEFNELLESATGDTDG